MAKKPKTLINKLARVIDRGLAWLFTPSQEEKESDLQREDALPSFVGSAARRPDKKEVVSTDREPAVSMTPVRSLSMPKLRLEFPQHFMLETMDFVRDTKEELVLKIDTALQKNGFSLDTVGRITIAYPHKDPNLFTDRRGGYDAAMSFLEKVSEAAPQVEWLTADALCDTVHLQRMWNGHNSLYTITKSHTYAVRPELQERPLPFLDPDNKKQEVFIIVDDILEQGTTVANLCSYLTHNGALVLGAAVDGELEILQKRYGWDDDVDLKAEFKDANRNTGQLPALARAFTDSALKHGHREATPDKCLEVFEEALREHGKSVFSLTQAECFRLINTVDTEHEETSFPDLLQQMYLDARYRKFSQRKQPIHGA